MRKSELLEIVMNLKFDVEFALFKDGITVLHIIRPSKVSSTFKNYDTNKNFQIWMNEDQRTFRSNHLQLLMDPNLRVRSNPQLRKKYSHWF